ncbi:50S ribosomal protein L9 [Pedomonas mirosovicensis]|uniref:50S ribosomal protein L9 n=1 Tax=Pedomonas mirosovicensis TaxID=2908641 RepID=UPI002169A355|nr:50S ribosomal protein L9 [Pedomonas mirosovicensis]MCH8685672.1 50S ribosomal protein L9 [Pedomonas mirosovicensis]
MELILLERVEKLGTIGDIVSVKPGFARNYLLPKRKALRATEENKKLFEAQRAQIEAENQKRREAAAEQATKVTGKSVVLIRQAGNTGLLYGSVSSRDIAEALSEVSGVAIAKSQVVLDRPIKALGLYTVRIALHAEVVETITVNVARSADEAELQAKGVDVTKEVEEEEEAPVEATEAEAEAPAEATDTEETKA